MILIKLTFPAVPSDKRSGFVDTTELKNTTAHLQKHYKYELC